VIAGCLDHSSDGEPGSIFAKKKAVKAGSPVANRTRTARGSSRGPKRD